MFGVLFKAVAATAISLAGMFALMVWLAEPSANPRASIPLLAETTAPSPALPQRRGNGLSIVDSAGASVPTGHRLVFLNSNLSAPRGDVHAQALIAFKSIARQLAAQDLSMSDVVYLRAYLMFEKSQGDRPDFAGFTVACDEAFGSSVPRRSIVAVSALSDPDALIEIEAIAADRKSRD